VANRVREPDDGERVARRTGLEVVATVPWDEELAEAERQGRAPIDHAPSAAAVAAVELLVESMMERLDDDRPNGRHEDRDKERERR
jgi:CO dehydrogenase maturation factor